MDRLLARLERTFLGRLAIERLTTFIVGGMGIVLILSLARADFIPFLALDPHLVSKQPWRLVTFLFIPPASRWLVWTLVSIYFTWLIGTNLEQEWGALKFNVYYFLGAIGTLVAALVTGESQGNVWLNLTLFFAFATLFPDFIIRLFFILPIKIKWLGLLAALAVGFAFVVGNVSQKAAIGAAFGNYLLFFAGHLVAVARGRKLVAQQAVRRASQRSATVSAAAKTAGRECAICGARQDDGADIRVCSCEKCGGTPRNLCLEHARNH